jgi:AraC-like DNA-binding protein
VGDPDVALANCSIHRPWQLPGVEIVAAGIGVRRFPAHVSDGLGICVKSGAAHDVVVDGRRLRYPADSVSVRTPGCLWTSETGVHGFISVDVPGERLPPDWSGRAIEFLGRRMVPDVAALARRITGAADALEAEEVLTGLLGAVFATGTLRSDEAFSAAGSPSAVADACEYLRANVAGRPALDKVAAAVGVSKYALLRRFRAALGTTPHAYLVMVRVSRAQVLLARGATPAEAATACGFADQAHMGVWFRRMLGVTPAAYRRQSRGAISLQTRVKSSSP